MRSPVTMGAWTEHATDAPTQNRSNPSGSTALNLRVEGISAALATVAGVLSTSLAPKSSHVESSATMSACGLVLSVPGRSIPTSAERASIFNLPSSAARSRNPQHVPSAAGRVTRMDTMRTIQNPLKSFGFVPSAMANGTGRNYEHTS